MGSRFVLQFDATGNAESTISGINRGLQQMKGVSGDAGGTFTGSMKSAGMELNALADRLTGFSDRMSGAYADIIGFGTNMSQSIVADAAKFQDTEAAMRFAFGPDKWKGMFDKVKAEAADLTMTFDEVSNLAASFGRMKLNPFGTEKDDVKVFKAKTGEAVSALQVLQDVIDGTGAANDRVLFGTREALTGDWKSLRDTLDLSKEQQKEWQKAMDKGKDKQEKYNILIQKMADIYGGAGAMKAGNWLKIMAQIPDLMQQLRAGIGAEGLKVMTEGLKDFVNALTGLAKDKDAVHALSNGFMVIATAVKYAFEALAWLIRKFTEILKVAPWLPPVAVGFALIAAAVFLGVSAFVALTAAVVSFVAAIALAGAEVIGIGVALSLAAIPATIALGAALAFVGLIAYGTYQVIQKHFGGAAAIFDGIKAAVMGIYELFSSYDGKTGKMSKNTANALKNAGIYDFIVDLFQLYHRVRVFFSGFGEVLGNIGDSIAPVLIPLLTELKALFFSVMEAFAPGFADAATSDTEKWAMAGRKLASAIVEAVIAVIQLVRWGVAIAQFAVDCGAVTFAINAWHEAIWVAKMIFGTMTATAGMVMDSLFPIATPIWQLVSAIRTAKSELAMLVKGASILGNVMSGNFVGAATDAAGAAFSSDGSADDTKGKSGGFAGVDPKQGVKGRAYNGVVGSDNDSVLKNMARSSGIPDGNKLAPAPDPALQAISGNTTQANGLLAQIAAAIAGLDLSVYLDSEQIASAIKAKGGLEG